MANLDRVYKYSFGSIYPHYVTKVEKKGRTAAELDEVLCWLTGYTPKGLKKVIDDGTDLETFFAQAPKPSPARTEITGMICGVRVEEIEEPTMQEIRRMDKVVDELAKGKAMEKILRSE